MSEQPDSERRSEFKQAASDPGFLAELGEFLIESKKFWLVPLLVALLLLGLLVVLSGPSVAPFIYSIF